MAAQGAPSARAAQAEPEPPAIVVAPQSHPELFSFDDTAESQDADRADRHSVTLTLDPAEHARLVERAKQRGVSVEELLRSWI